MRFYKASLRALITLSSAFSFLGGWILLAHSLKPTQSNSIVSTSTAVATIVPLPTLAPLPSFDSQPVQQIQSNPIPIIIQQPQVQSMPNFTTSGS